VNVLAEYEFDEELTGHFGTGLVMRTAGLTERYFAFGPAPGGYLVGNPTLDAEKRIEFVAGIKWQQQRMQASVSAYHNWVIDYILPTQIASQDINGDGADDIIRGFRNVDARLWGFDGTLNMQPTTWLEVPVTAAWVAGRNTSDGRPLPEIPPFEVRAALRAKQALNDCVDCWAQFGGRFVARQDRIDEMFPEDETPGFAVFHLRGGVTLRRNLHIEVGIENLFDKEYHEHLTPPAPVGSGDLSAGDEVNAPGRTFVVHARWDF
jgi:outer membrane receptor for ferrienterochelin and colicin